MIRKTTAYLAVGLFAPIFAACTSTIDEPSVPEIPDAPASAIDFRSSLDSRALIADFASGDAISVWGFNADKADGLASTSWNQVFAGGSDGSIAVTKGSDGNWTYESPRNWEAGKFYTFHAFFCPTGDATFSYNQTQNTLTIADFDATRHADLLYDVTTRDYDSEGSSPVPFNFRHLLSQVTFVGKTDPAVDANSISVTINSAKLYGVASTGSWTSAAVSTTEKSPGTWTLSGQATTADAPFAQRIDLPLTQKALDLFDQTDAADNQILIFPLTSLSDAVFELTYTYSYTSGTGSTATTTRQTSTQTFALGSIAGGPAAWEAGKTYRYNFTVSVNDYILFAPPSVDDWKPGEIGGDDALDKE